MEPNPHAVTSPATTTARSVEFPKPGELGKLAQTLIRTRRITTRTQDNWSGTNTHLSRIPYCFNEYGWPVYSKVKIEIVDGTLHLEINGSSASGLENIGELLSNPMRPAFNEHSHFLRRPSRFEKIQNMIRGFRARNSFIKSFVPAETLRAITKKPATLRTALFNYLWDSLKLATPEARRNAHQFLTQRPGAVIYSYRYHRGTEDDYEARMNSGDVLTRVANGQPLKEVMPQLSKLDWQIVEKLAGGIIKPHSLGQTMTLWNKLRDTWPENSPERNALSAFFFQNIPITGLTEFHSRFRDIMTHFAPHRDDDEDEPQKYTSAERLDMVRWAIRTIATECVKPKKKRIESGVIAHAVEAYVLKGKPISFDKKLAKLLDEVRRWDDEAMRAERPAPTRPTRNTSANRHSFYTEQVHYISPTSETFQVLRDTSRPTATSAMFHLMPDPNPDNIEPRSMTAEEQAAWLLQKQEEETRIATEQSRIDTEELAALAAEFEKTLFTIPENMPQALTEWNGAIIEPCANHFQMEKLGREAKNCLSKQRGGYYENYVRKAKAGECAYYRIRNIATGEIVAVEVRADGEILQFQGRGNTGPRSLNRDTFEIYFGNMVKKDYKWIKDTVARLQLWDHLYDPTHPEKHTVARHDIRRTKDDLYDLERLDNAFDQARKAGAPEETIQTWTDTLETWREKIDVLMGEICKQEEAERQRSMQEQELRAAQLEESQKQTKLAARTYPGRRVYAVNRADLEQVLSATAAQANEAANKCTVPIHVNGDIVAPPRGDPNQARLDLYKAAQVDWNFIGVKIGEIPDHLPRQRDLPNMREILATTLRNEEIITVIVESEVTAADKKTLGTLAQATILIEHPAEFDNETTRERYNWAIGDRAYIPAVVFCELMAHNKFQGFGYPSDAQRVEHNRNVLRTPRNEEGKKLRRASTKQAKAVLISMLKNRYGTGTRKEHVVDILKKLKLEGHATSKRSHGSTAPIRRSRCRSPAFAPAGNLPH